MACCSCLSDKEAPVASILRCSNLTTGMDDAEIAELLASSQVRRHVFSAGEIVFHDGDQPHSLYILLRGEVHILKDTFSGRRIFISEVNEPGDMFGEVYEVLKRPYDIYVEAAKETELLEIGSRFFTIGGQSEHLSPQCLARRAQSHAHLRAQGVLHARPHQSARERQSARKRSCASCSRIWTQRATSSSL